MPSNSEVLIQQAKAEPLDRRSRDLRRRVVDAVAGERRGHLGPAFSLLEIVRTLYDDHLDFRPDEPDWSLRDRAILSKGHGCLALYAILADKGFFPLRRSCLLLSQRRVILGGTRRRRRFPVLRPPPAPSVTASPSASVWLWRHGWRGVTIGWW